MKQLNTTLLGKIKEIENSSTSLWLEQMSIDSISDNVVSISFPNNYIADFVKNNISDSVYKLISNVLGHNSFVISYSTRENIETKIEQDYSIDTASKSVTGSIATKQKKKRTALNNKYTFDRYVVGMHNEMAYSIGRLIVDDIEKSKENYNPFIIHSDTGLGKTHLIQSIYFDLIKKGTRAIYLTSENFVEMFMKSSNDKNRTGFLDNFKDYDVIILDDIQFFEGKVATQEMFKRLFMHIINSNKSIILTLDRPVEKLNIVAEGLIEELSKGLSLELTYPDFFTRIEIIKSKFLQNFKFKNIPDNLLTFIAAQFDNVNVRVLEGVVNKISFACKHLNFSLESEKIKQFICPTTDNDTRFITSSQLNIKKIVSEVTNYFGISMNDLKGNSKKKNIALPRKISMFLIRDILGQSYETIGEFFNRTAAASKYSCTSVEDSINVGDTILSNHIMTIKSYF